MASTNDITGDSISTGVVTNEYRDHHELIFGKKEPKPRWVPPPLPDLDVKTKATDLGSKEQSQ